MKDKIIKFIDGLGKMSVNEWVQMIVFLFAIINGALIICGASPINVSEHFIYVALSGALVVIVPIYNKWKNWNVTKEAITGQEVTDLIKDGVLTIIQVENYIRDMKAQALKEEWSNPTYDSESGVKK